MSDRRNPQGNTYRQAGGNKGYTKTQKVFVPKNQDHNRPSSPKSPNPKLSASLSRPMPELHASLLPRVVLDWTPWSLSQDEAIAVESITDWTPKPQDEAIAAGLGADEGELDAVESQRVIDLLNRELSRLLKLNPKEFWRQVASDTSLHEFRESFLQFRSRWYDFPHSGAKDMVTGVIVGELELSRRVFMVLYRM